MSAKAMNPVQIPQAKGIVIDTTGAEIVAEDSPAVSLLCVTCPFSGPAFVTRVIWR